MAHCQPELEAYAAAEIAAADAQVAADVAYAAYAACEASHQMSLTQSEFKEYARVRLKMGDPPGDIKKSLTASRPGK